MDAILEKISRIGIVPVIKIDRIEDAEPLARALCETRTCCFFLCRDWQ